MLDERLDDGAFIQGVACIGNPVGIRKQDIRIDPRELGVFIGQARYENIQQALLLPQNALRPYPDDVVVLREGEWCVTKCALDAPPVNP
jgi:hypothetical protein